MTSLTTSATIAEGTAPLTDLYRSWGVLGLLGETIERVPAEWLQILQIARTLLDGKPVPGVEVPAYVTALLARPAPVQRPVGRPSSGHRVASLPEEPEVRPIDSISELHRIVPGQMMWQYFEPELFMYRVYCHDVLVREREEVVTRVDDDRSDEHAAAPDTTLERRQRVLVLRDTSFSMRDANKGVFAKAVALAYLLRAYEEGAEVADRSFANSVHPRLRASTPAELGALARRVLTDRYVGTTNLAEALDQSAREIRREELGLNPSARARTEILLISDCENPVSLPPLPPGVVVNTLHLQGGREGVMVRGYAERLGEIEAISSRFFRIDTSALDLPDSASEAWTAMEDLRDAEEELDGLGAGDTDMDPTLLERARQARELVQIYERLGSTSGRGGGTGGMKLTRVYVGDAVNAGEFFRALRAALLGALARLGHALHVPHPHMRVHVPLHRHAHAHAASVQFRTKG